MTPRVWMKMSLTCRPPRHDSDSGRVAMTLVFTSAPPSSRFTPPLSFRALEAMERMIAAEKGKELGSLGRLRKFMS